MTITERIEKEALSRFPEWKRTELYDILEEYFTKSPKFTDRGYDLSKGILTLGGVGTGKTTAFEVFHRISRGTNQYFQMVATRHIVREFRVQQDIIIDRYGRNSFKTKPIMGGGSKMDHENPLTYYFDDLGLEETNARTFGNATNVMADILLDRYDNFKNYGQKTFGSSNLDADGLEKVYGARMRDRFKEMMNVITINGESFRK